ncbi:MAG: hypothetical protein WCT52_05645 [Candidatus Micrarchaeia archaeon]
MDFRKFIALALLLFAAAGGMLYACSAFGTSCTSVACCNGLVCDNGLCNQPSSLCDNMPSAWQNPQVTSGNGSPSSPYDAVMGQVYGNGTAAVGSSSEFYRQGWFSDWNSLGLAGVMISIIIIAIAAMMGQAFNLTEVKAFAKTEIMQAVVSLLLIAGLMALVQFFDIVAIEAIESMNLPVSCNPSEPCYITAAKEYITNIQGVADQYAQNNLKESFDRMRVAMRGANVQFNVWWAAFAGANTRWNAGESIQAERAGALFDSLSKVLVSLYAQKYLIEVVSFGIAPVLLLLGIVMRTFYFTRKLGGLLLAIAISLFIVYPLTFTFAWFTLNVTVYGERSIAANDPVCPIECTARYPVAFYTNSSGNIIQFETMQSILRAQINDSNWASNPVYTGLVACRDLSNIGISATPACQGCPDYCREVPFQAGLPGCSITQCSTCNSGCKVMRQRYDCPTLCDANECSPECLTTQPVENKCYYRQNLVGSPTVVPANLSVSCAACDACPNWCKIVFLNSSGQYELVNKDEAPCQISACLPQGSQMNDNDGALVNGNCPIQCLYVSGVLGSDNKCDNLCTDPNTGARCPNYCRVRDLSSLAPYDTSDPSLIASCTGDEFGNACSLCPDSCKVSALPENETFNLTLCAPYPRLAASVENCTACPHYCRFNNYANYSGFSNIFTIANDSTFPDMCDAPKILGMNCSPSTCSVNCRGATTPQLCEEYNASAPVAKYCSLCPEETRGLTLMHNLTSGVTETITPIYTPAVTAGCQDAVCAMQCKPQMNLTVPAECLAYGAPAPAAQDLCNLCPEEVRGLSLHHINTDGTEQTVSPALMPSISSGCSSSSCAPYCQRSVTVEVPNATANPACRDISPATNTQTAYNDAIIYGSGTSVISLQYPTIPGTGTMVVEAEIMPGTNISVSLNGVFIGNMTTSPRSWSGISALVAGNNNVVFSSQNAGSNITNTTITSTYADEYNCNICPISCRVNFAQGNWLDPSCNVPACTVNCLASCKADAPPASSVRMCSDYNGGSISNCQQCPIRCRLVMSNDTWLDPGCDVPACQDPNCEIECKADSSSMAPPLCLGYMGNGPVDWQDYSCRGSFENCATFTDNQTCVDNACAWTITPPDTSIPIYSRSAPYNDASNCQQCPENCRVRYDDGTNAYTGSCGQTPDAADGVDCSLSACAMNCRAEIPTPSPPAALPSICQAADLSSGSCSNCPALCRRYDISAPPETPYCDQTYCSQEQCIDQCRLPDPPSKMCESCVECPTDCLYRPATRTDCTEYCSDEALAGPINVGPQDFIKKLPGAYGKEDAKGVGVLMLPALILPMFGLVMVIAFIRVLSPLLGGDIEIPGLGRII